MSSEAVATSGMDRAGPRRDLEWALAAVEARGLPMWAISAVVAGLIALWDVTGWSLWHDEVATASAVSRSLPDLFRMLGNIDVALGFYYVLMNLWTSVAGTSELALRAPSILAVAGAAGLTTILGRRSGSLAVGLGAGLLLASLPVLTSFHAQEARPYSLTVLLAAAASLSVVLAVETGRARWWVAYGVALAALGLMHFLALPVAVAHLGFVLPPIRRRDVLAWAISAGSAALPAVAVLAIAQEQSRVWDWIEPISTGLLYELPEMPVGTPTLAWFLFGLAVAGGVVAGGRWRALLVLWLVIPPLTLVLGSELVRPMLVPRYLMIVAPALALLAAIALVRTRALIPGLIVVALLAIPGALDWRDRPQRMEDFRAAASFVMANQLPGDAIAYEAERFRMGFTYYLPDSGDPADPMFERTAAKDGWIADSAFAPSAERLAGYDRVWVVHDGQGEPFADVPGMLQDRQPADSRSFRGSMVVTLYER